MLTALAFLLDDAAKSIRRNGLMTLAALSTVTISMGVFGGSLFGLFRLHQFAAAQPRRFEIAAFMRVSVPRADVADVVARVRGLAGVTGVKLVTKEQALAELCAEDVRHATSIAQALEGENPLPDRLDVRVRAPALTASVSRMLSDTRRFPEIECVRDERDVLDKLMAVSNLVRNVGGTAALLLFICTGIVIQNTLRLTVVARRKEIRIMQLVGATPGFVRTPLVFEGVFHGVTGAGVAGALVLLVVGQVSSYVSRFQTPLSAGLPPAPGPWVVLTVLVVAGGILGLVSSVFSIRRFLR